MVKSPAEIDRVRRAVASAAAGYQAALDAAKPGMTEKELVSIIASTMYSTGSTAGTRPVFVNSVSGRERYPLVDTPASDRRIAAGDIVFIDGGAASDGYVSDILRLIGVGPLRAEDRRLRGGRRRGDGHDGLRRPPRRAASRDLLRAGRRRWSPRRASPPRSAWWPGTGSALSCGSAR